MNRATSIYLDNHSTTRCDPRVVEAMLPYFGEDYGNAGSRHHSFGWRAKEAVDTAREQVAALLGATPREVIFTSGATESNNLAVRGVASQRSGGGDHLVTVTTEHKAVLDPCRRLEREGFRVSYLPVDPFGSVTAEQVAQVLTDGTLLVSVMAANNEVGTLPPIAEIGQLCQERGILFHTDAAQAAGRIPIAVEPLGVDLVSLSAHKMYGPKGVGALLVRNRGRRVRLTPILDGGGQERGLRSGTLNVPGIVGLGRACELAMSEGADEAKRLVRLRMRLHAGITNQLEDVTLNGHPTERLPGNLNLSFAYVDGGALLMGLRGVAVSSGSACTSADPEPSYVLRALGVPDDLAQASIRFGLGRFNTEDEVDRVVAEVVRTVKQLRAQSPMYEMARKGK